MESESDSEELTDGEGDEVEDEPIYYGKRNSEGFPQGRGTLKWAKSGNRFEGRFIDGLKEGRGCFYFSDSSTLSGNYREDQLEGETLYTHADGGYMTAEYLNGEMEGPFTEHAPDGSVVTRGTHKGGCRSGVLQTFDEFGGSVIGTVDSEGQLTGDDIAYIYPDKETVLIGQFEDGQLVSARAAKLDSMGTSKAETNGGELKLPKVSYRTDYPETIHFDMSSHDILSLQPLLCDVYEQDRVCVQKSLIENAGEGLFARVDLEADEVAAFYNGVRLSHDEVDSRDWSVNGNTLSLDDDTVIDVPAKYASTDVYCATLGHKANHSKDPNCKYDVFYHPRYYNFNFRFHFISRYLFI
jgi:histone-lysine N-methyltransferase SETD7